MGYKRRVCMAVGRVLIAVTDESKSVLYNKHMHAII